MSEITWTEEELRAFDHASMEMSSRDQVTRIRGRMTIHQMVRDLGKEKCDAMFEEIKRREKKKR